MLRVLFKSWNRYQMHRQTIKPQQLLRTHDTSISEPHVSLTSTFLGHFEPHVPQPVPVGS